MEIEISADRRTKEPGVSVFLPTAFRYSDGYLERAVESLMGQQYTEWELLAVDDGSTDGTCDYLAGLARRDARIRHIRLRRNVGLPAFTLSLAWAQARGSRFAWLFDDCEYLPDHLSTLVAELDENPGAGMAYGVARAELADGKSYLIGSPFELAGAESGNNCIANVCVLVRREAIDAVGWYDPHVLMKRVCDWDLWLRIGKSFPVRFVDQLIAIEHGTSLPQSLGRACLIDMDLVKAYAATDRNARLHPARLVEHDCYRTDLGIRLTSAQAESLDLQLFEHALFTMNAPLALASGSRVAASFASRVGRTTQGEDSSPDATLLASARLLRRRTQVSADREIELETSLRTALAAADGRTKELDRLQGDFARTQRAVDAFRDAADQRFALVGQLQRQLEEQGKACFALQAVADARLEAIAEIQSQFEASAAATQSFRDAADKRLEIIASLQSSLDSASALTNEFRNAADSRYALLQSTQQRLAESESASAALRADLRAARDQIEEARARYEEIAVRLEAMADRLSAAGYRIEEARRVQSSLSGRIAFWLDRTFGS